MIDGAGEIGHVWCRGGRRRIGGRERPEIGFQPVRRRARVRRGCDGGPGDQLGVCTVAPREDREADPAVPPGPNRLNDLRRADSLGHALDLCGGCLRIHRVRDVEGRHDIGIGRESVGSRAPAQQGAAEYQ
jgi:hypothetical protein